MKLAEEFTPNFCMLDNNIIPDSGKYIKPNTEYQKMLKSTSKIGIIYLQPFEWCGMTGCFLA